MLHHIENKARKTIPLIPWRKITDCVLGEDYELSLAFIGNQVSKKLNNHYRHKDRPTNILSFPLEKNEGEILINIKIVKKEAKELKEKESSYLAYIFIHGLLHLKGFRHGSRMETEEKKIREKFSEK